ncbi:hypothetical protein, partial [Xanthovirga aplysinae]|uniref:hypothetical protein n=1 Tax=Xanthovirga aplysinae TaxID=2529853 RepID=UPI0016572695
AALIFGHYNKTFGFQKNDGTGTNLQAALIIGDNNTTIGYQKVRRSSGPSGAPDDVFGLIDINSNGLPSLHGLSFFRLNAQAAIVKGEWNKTEGYQKLEGPGLNAQLAIVKGNKNHTVGYQENESRGILINGFPTTNAQAAIVLGDNNYTKGIQINKSVAGNNFQAALVIGSWNKT